MRWSQSIRNFVVRLLTALFAVQIIAAGFCLLVPQAHAMVPMASSQIEGAAAFNIEMNASCADSDSQHASEANGCFHCETPDLASVIPVELASFDMSAMLLFVVASIATEEAAIETTPFGDLHDPGGSAGDRALLFHLIPRIRV